MFTYSKILNYLTRFKNIKFLFICLNLQIQKQTESCKFEQEIRQEQEEKKKQAEDAKERKKAFKEKASVFTSAGN